MLILALLDMTGYYREIHVMKKYDSDWSHDGHFELAPGWLQLLGTGTRSQTYQRAIAAR